MSTVLAKPTFAATLAELWRKDLLFLPAVFIAIVGTLYTVLFPPSWIGRVPTALHDVVTGKREQLAADLSDTTAKLEQRETALESASQTITVSENTIGEQERTIAALGQTLQGRDALVASLSAEQEKASSELERQTEQLATLADDQAQLDEIKLRLTAATQALDERTAAIDEQGNQMNALRRDLAKRSSDLRTAEAALEHQTSVLANTVAERDALSNRVTTLSSQGTESADLTRELEATRATLEAREADIGRLNVTARDAQGEQDRMAGAVESLRQRLAETRQKLVRADQATQAKVAELDARQREFDQLTRQLQAVQLTRTELSQGSETLRAALDSVRSTLAGREEMLETRSSELKAEQEKLAELTTKLRETEETRSALLASAAASKSEIDAERGRSAELQARLSNVETELEADRGDAEALRAELAVTSGVVATLEARVREHAEQRAESETQLAASQGELQKKEERAARLTRQVDMLGDEVFRLLAVLSASETKSERQEKTIIDERGRLGSEFGRRLAELNRFRSDFFGKLRTVLGEHDDVNVVGDRFVFQAEVLFPSGAAKLEPNGRTQLTKVATTLKQIAREIPSDIDWILRVDGHTDKRPIQSRQFPSNWELSAARAIAVVQFLVEQGLPPVRLSANGFGEFQPLEDSDAVEAYSRNRRIELKLTER